VLIAGHNDPSILGLFTHPALGRVWIRSVLFVLVAGEDHHRHAEHGGPGPEPMMLHEITSCMENSYSPLIQFHDTAICGKSQINESRNSARKNRHCAESTIFSGILSPRLILTPNRK
jgi:hypothetical protein